MKKVVIISLPENDERVRSIVTALSPTSVETFWRHASPADEAAWAETIVITLDARCVVFVWSRALAEAASSIRNRYYELVAQAVAQRSAIAVEIDLRARPAGLDAVTTYSLSRHWITGAHQDLTDIVMAVHDKAADVDPSPPRPWFARMWKLAAAAGVGALSAFALFIGLYRDTGLDKIASPAEAAAWSKVTLGSCRDLRGFLATFSDGAHAQQAQAMINSREVATHVIPVATERELPLFIGAGDAMATPTEAAARAVVRRRAGAESASRCRQLASAGGARLAGATFAAQTTICQPLEGGVVCSTDGTATCRLHEPREEEVERCGAGN